MFYDNVTLLDDALNTKKLPILETFECPYDTSIEQSGVIRIIFPEFTCVCPKTGYPDFASINLYYLPNTLCIELKSWKLYLNAFRMIGTFHETVTHHLFKTITTLLNPHWALLVGNFTPRGNVGTTVVFETSTTRPKESNFLINTIPTSATALSGD